MFHFKCYGKKQKLGTNTKIFYKLTNSLHVCVADSVTTSHECSI